MLNLMITNLELNGYLPIRALDAGLVISRGTERHMDRTIGCFDLLFVREGILPIQEEQQAFQVGAGEVLILWPGRHHWGTEKFSPDMRMYWLHFTVHAEVSSPTSVMTASQSLSVPQYTKVSRPDFLESLLRRYIDDQETGRLLPHYANLLVWLILSEVADQRPVSSSNRTTASVAGRALAYIRSHVNQPLTVSAISEELGYNPEYLNRAFHQIYQRTLTQEIHYSRMGYSRHLLLNTNKNVKEIALAAGFTDTSYFSRLFKRYEGMTPMEFRRLNAQIEVNFE